MVQKLSTEHPVIKELIPVFTKETKSATNEIAAENEFVTENFKQFGGWDVIFKRIAFAAIQIGLIALVKKRGPWNFVAILNDETEDLYVFTKEKNINSVIKKFGKNSIHYFHALVTKNGTPKELDTQMEFFPSTNEEYEMKRLAIAQKVLGEDYADIQRVVFIVAQESIGRIVGAEARLYDQNFNVIESADWSSYISKNETRYEDFVEHDYIEEESDKVVIPKIKDDLKKQKTDPKVANKKTSEDKEDDEVEDRDS